LEKASDRIHLVEANRSDAHQGERAIREYKHHSCGLLFAHYWLATCIPPPTMIMAKPYQAAIVFVNEIPLQLKF
jgi:hypothetical protein